MLTATTAKSLPPSLVSSVSKAGISSRQGTHHVAQILRSTILPRKSAKDLDLPSASAKVNSGRSRGFGLTRGGALAALLRPARGGRAGPPFVYYPPAAGPDAS